MWEQMEVHVELGLDESRFDGIFALFASVPTARELCDTCFRGNAARGIRKN